MAAKLKKSRYIAVIVLTVLVFAALLLRFIQWQVVEYDSIYADATKRAQQVLQTEAARGDIVDRYGRVLATSSMSYSIVIQKGEFPGKSETQKRINVVLSLYNILEQNGETVNSRLPIVSTPQGYEYTENSETEKAALFDMVDKQSYATAQNCFDALVKRYALSDLTPEDALKVIKIRYEMERGGFDAYYAVSVADKVSVATLTAISENLDSLAGVRISAVPARAYVKSGVAAHIVGYTGPIFAEEYADYKEQGYKMDDIVGKSGVEKLAEEYLKGKDGTSLQDINSEDGMKVVEDAQPGATVVLTIDSYLQQVAQEQLEATIKEIAEKGIKEGNQGADANAGAAVVIDVNSGDVLAAVNYPTYDINDLLTNYSAVAESEGSPLYNRAFQGLYEPGSSYKPLVALAALENGIITPSTRVVCTHRYTYYADYRPKCLGTHGSINLEHALAVSCNYYFFEVGRRTTIEVIEDYAAQVGLGQKTNIGLPESTGSVSGPENSAKLGKVWVPGDTLQAAIGQGDNLFTPLQLANYVATLANGGTHYQPRIIRSVISRDNTEILVDDEPTVLNTLDVDSANIAAVLEGMRSVTTDGTGASVFGDYAIAVGGKTGSAEVPTGSPNAIFIAFAPYDDPQIAVAIVIEHGWHGGSAANVAKAIFDAYFFPEGQQASAEVGKLAQ